MAREPTRDKLINAAQQLFYEQGVHRTTLADIAQAAAVPLGNVYYHFRTKDALIEAVTGAHLQHVAVELAQYDQEADPRERLRALVQASLADGSDFARYGCPYATLCQELEKDVGPLSTQAGGFFRRYVDWAERQFRLLGADGAAHELAVELIAKLQGSYMLTYAYRSPELLVQQMQRTEVWLDQVI